MLLLIGHAIKLCVLFPSFHEEEKVAHCLLAEVPQSENRSRLCGDIVLGDLELCGLITS